MSSNQEGVSDKARAAERTKGGPGRSPAPTARRLRAGGLLASGEAILNPVLATRDGLLVYEQWSNETNIYRMPLRATPSEASSGVGASLSLSCCFTMNAT